ncbi:histidine phosphatase family protein [Paenibacillus sp. GD4]|uniref:histidine phosphatase family protein n=1 Tax=Paenibacillus sp. GD4 TaxID=3068890 RepID=UPI002796A2AE|nr:histidine phosphatase family protein [Paenibacillus sp. GD4]MDQ1909399.1 histidine phosphatase family protein [Paenibacillus sp. GD4]
MIQLGLIRHGTTEWNLEGRMQGQMDTPLAEVGRVQAKLLANRLKYEAWDGIIASDLMRAHETALTIEKITGVPLLGVDARLRERAFGQLEGTTVQDRIAKWGEDWREREHELGLESDDSLLQRWDSFVSETEQVHPGKKLLIVSHGGYIVPVITRILQGPLEEHLNNTSLTVLHRNEKQWDIHLLNCTLHLNELST